MQRDVFSCLVSLSFCLVSLSLSFSPSIYLYMYKSSYFFLYVYIFPLLIRMQYSTNWSNTGIDTHTHTHTITRTVFLNLKLLHQCQQALYFLCMKLCGWCWIYSCSVFSCCTHTHTHFPYYGWQCTRGEKKVGSTGFDLGLEHWLATWIRHTRRGFSISHGFVGGWRGTFVAFQRHWNPNRTKLGH